MYSSRKGIVVVNVTSLLVKCCFNDYIIPQVGCHLLCINFHYERIEEQFGSVIFETTNVLLGVI